MPGQFKRLDDVWTAEYVRDESAGKLFRRLFQPNRAALLGTIRQLRDDRIVPADSPMGRWCLSIPRQDWEELRRNPKWADLHAPDSATQQATMQRFLQSPDSAPYRVQERAS